MMRKAGWVLVAGGIDHISHPLDVTVLPLGACSFLSWPRIDHLDEAKNHRADEPVPAVTRGALEKHPDQDAEPDHLDHPLLYECPRSQFCR